MQPESSLYGRCLKSRAKWFLSASRLVQWDDIASEVIATEPAERQSQAVAVGARLPTWYRGHFILFPGKRTHPRAQV